MTAQPMLTFPSAPTAGDTLTRVKTLANDWLADQDWRRFTVACLIIANANDGEVDPNKVRAYLTNAAGELSIKPSRYSSFWGTATATKGKPGRKPFLDNIDGPEGWTLNTDHAGGNAGKPIRLRRLRSNA